MKIRFFLFIIAAVYAAAVFNQTRKDLPPGVSVSWPDREIPASSIKFLADRTWVDEAGERHTDQQIFDEVRGMIAGAQEYILADMFLFNNFQGEPPEETRALADELTQALVEKKAQVPDITITVVSDPLNTVYGGARSPHFEKLNEAGIEVVLTDLTELRDSNPIYSAAWRALWQWWGNSERGGLMPHPFGADGERVTLRSWLALLNFKANHRKLIVADTGQPARGNKLATLVTSANPHDGSSAHANVAVRIDDLVWQDAIASEIAVGEFSGTEIPGYRGEVKDVAGPVKVQLLTEGAIQRRLVEVINAAGEEDTIDMAMFYLSDREIIEALISAADRGASVRLVLDANKDAFGRTKNGIPNRPVAAELIEKSENRIQIRWCETHGEQCHSKLVLFRTGGKEMMTIGSANLTRRNIGDLNLETNVLIEAEGGVPAIAAARKYFEEVWNNKEGRTYTAEYEKYADDSGGKYLLYRVQEATGLSSF